MSNIKRSAGVQCAQRGCGNDASRSENIMLHTRECGGYINTLGKLNYIASKWVFKRGNFW